ncbi:MAG: KilA-N domain-containing protein [Opitutales bacterium]
MKVIETEVTVRMIEAEDFICLTDIAKDKEPKSADHVIQNWMRNRNTVEFLEIWERLNNPDFKPLEFEGVRKEAVPSQRLRPIRTLSEYSTCAGHAIGGSYSQQTSRASACMRNSGGVFFEAAGSIGVKERRPRELQ